VPRPTFLNLPSEKRARVADAAIEEFSLQGYGGGSISAIVARAGISKGSFYQYFDSKIDLFRWLVLEHAVERKLAFLAAQPEAQAGDFWALLGDLMLAGIRFALANPRLARLGGFLWHPRGDPDLARVAAEAQVLAHRSWVALLAQGREAGHVRADLDLDVAADFVHAQLTHGLDLAVQRLVGVDLAAFCALPEMAWRMRERDLRRLIAQSVDLLRRALGTPKPPLRIGDERLIDLTRLAPEPER